ncbi:hypothetical protein CGRA01v4_13977 [Colletotrichum graminicola]|nr:hypothetical protein CGRA01v4_13977 [Colletotrichum graminicola]
MISQGGSFSSPFLSSYKITIYAVQGKYLSAAAKSQPASPPNLSKNGRIQTQHPHRQELRCQVQDQRAQDLPCLWLRYKRQAGLHQVQRHRLLFSLRAESHGDVEGRVFDRSQQQRVRQWSPPRRRDDAAAHLLGEVVGPAAGLERRQRDDGPGRVRRGHDVRQRGIVGVGRRVQDCQRRRGPRLRQPLRPPAAREGGPDAEAAGRRVVPKGRRDRDHGRRPRHAHPRHRL